MLQRHSWADSVGRVGDRVAVKPMEWLALEYLCFNMREADRHEISNMLPTANPLVWAADIQQAVGRIDKGCGYVGFVNGRPAGCIGLFENHPGCWQIYSFGTDDYARVLAYFEAKLHQIIAFARDRGMHRLECRSIATHKTAHTIIRMAGFSHEATLRQFGTDGEDYHLYTKVWPRVPRAPATERAAVEGGAAQRERPHGVIASPPQP